MQLKIRRTELLLQYAEKLTTHFLKEANLMKSKKKFVRLLCAVLTLCMISAITVFAANGDVYYDGDANNELVIYDYGTYIRGSVYTHSATSTTIEVSTEDVRGNLTGYQSASGVNEVGANAPYDSTSRVGILKCSAVFNGRTVNIDMNCPLNGSTEYSIVVTR